MSKIVWMAMISLDGYSYDRNGNINFHTPDDEVHSFINVLNSRCSTHIYDKQTFEIMKFWDDPGEKNLENKYVREYAAQYKKIKKIIVSYQNIPLPESNYEYVTDISVQYIEKIAAGSKGDIMIGSDPLAMRFLNLDKIDEMQIFVVPVLLGAGKKCFSDIGEKQLLITDQKRFKSGWMYLQYSVKK